MKKLTIILSVIGLLLMSMPMNASAASFKDDGSGNFCNDADISAGKYGTFKAGDVCYKYTDSANGIKEWTYRLTTKTNVKTIYLEVQPSSSIEIQSIKAGSGLLKADDTKTSTGNALLLFATNSNGINSGEKVTLFTVVTKDLATEGCYLNVSPLNPACQVIANTYLDKNGNIITKEQYEEVCEGVTPTDPDVPDTPNTGNPIPYIAVGGGLVALAGVYFYSRKSNKMYKI